MSISLKPQFDAAIVGGGPAGSSLAIRLAVGGLKVLLVEKAKFPREKLCGEFISPECLKRFDELGVLAPMRFAGAVEIGRTVFFARSGRSVAVESEWFGGRDSMAMGLSRAEMDNQLLERARFAGAEIREGTSATGPMTSGDGRVSGITIRDADGQADEISAELVIDATGRHRVLARRIAGQKTPRAGLVAFKTHVTGASVPERDCEIYAFRGGYGGCVRVEDGLNNLCFIASAADAKAMGSDPDRVLREGMFTNRRAADMLGNAKVAGEWHAVPISHFGRSSLVPATGLITVGDAAAFIDPFTGSGILLALESASIASAAILEHFARDRDFSTFAAEYERRYAAAFGRRLRLCSMLRHASVFPFIAESLIAALSLSSGLRRRLARATRFGRREI